MERLIDRIGKNDAVRIVTSDALIQLSAVRTGILRTSAREFHAEVKEVSEQIARLLEKMDPGERSAVRYALGPMLEEVRETDGEDA